jgi:hypothetical protein
MLHQHKLGKALRRNAGSGTGRLYFETVPNQWREILGKKHNLLAHDAKT